MFIVNCQGLAFYPCYTCTMKISDWLFEATKALEASGIGTARLDCLVLLEDIIGKDRAFLLAHPEFALTQKQIQELDNNIEQRQDHIPLAYIRSKTEFYRRKFFVNKDVLIPRPESESMIELLLKETKDIKSPSIFDIGTGCGALGITAKLEMPNSNVVGVDVDKKCLAVAVKNSRQLLANVDFVQGNLLDKIKYKIHDKDILLCNLPYVPNDFILNEAATKEPRLAIFGGLDGLNLYRNIFNQIDKLNEKPCLVFTESLVAQHPYLTSIAEKSCYSQINSKGLIQLFKKKPI